MSADPPEPHEPPVVPVDLRDYAGFDPQRAARVRVFATEVLTVDLWCLEPRQSTEAMALPDVDLAYTVLGGIGTFVTDQGEVTLGPLGSILVPADVVHGIDNRGADPLVVLAAGAPPDVPLSDLATDEPVEERGAAVYRARDKRREADRLNSEPLAADD